MAKARKPLRTRAPDDPMMLCPRSDKGGWQED